MKRIPLTQGKFALVDDADFNFLNQWKWNAQKDKNSFYAVRTMRGGHGRKAVLMHRVVMGGKGNERVDHVNSDGLDNRRENLRYCTNSENCKNRGKNKNNKSGFKGVSWKEANQKWSVGINDDGDRFYLGIFSDPIEAAKRYDVAAKLLHGKFARLNFPLITNPAT